VKQMQSGVELCQSSYDIKLLEKAGIKNCNPCATPMEARLKLSKDSASPAMDHIEFKSLIGSLRYLLLMRLDLTFSMLHMRPDLTFYVCYLNRFLELHEKTEVAKLTPLKHLK
jgi:hypothetical protein